MTGLEPHVERAVKVRGVQLGSGYAVGTDLVLTAGHLVGGRGDAVLVSRSDSLTAPEQRATVIWRGDAINADAALIRLDIPLWTAEQTRIRYGELRGHQPVACVTVGYPLVQYGRDGGRRIDELPGTVMPSLGFEDGRYALDSTRIQPKNETARQPGGETARQPGDETATQPKGGTAHPHAGYSGAPLLTADHRQLLLGVMVAVPTRYHTGRLDAARITRLLADPTFAALVGASPEDVELEPPQLLPAGIIEHDEARAELADNLRDDRLPYVPPAAGDAPTHPDRLLARLAECAGESGLLLVGQAGIGKTRTCLEVANRAVGAGWRVLHVRPGEPLVTTEQLLEAVNGCTDDRLLVVVDYLNLSGLDYPAIRHRLFPAARARGITLALLGSARPGWFHQRDNAPVTQAFRPVELNPDGEHLDRIRQQIIATLAPKARTILGDDRLAHLCGRRPIIATLIAAEAEAQAGQGLLSTATGDLRPEHLLDWLVRRLNEDDLLHHAERLDDHQEPDLRLQIYAAMAAATPQPQPEVITSGARVEGSDPGRAGHLLTVLQAMGWMITTPDGVAPVHDIVVDQLLEHTTVRSGLDTVRAEVADRILDACLTSARTIGRYAMNLARVLRDMALGDRGGPLAEHCAAWLAANATAAGTLLSSEQDAGAYALGSVLDNPPWAQALFQRWPQIAAPWLTAHGTSLPARHILYKGLRSVAAPQAAQLVAIATDWLVPHRTALAASFVLTPLLSRADLPPGTTGRAVETAMVWLRQHGDTTEAGYVLPPLLGRTDLSPEAAAASIEAALVWLRQHDTTTGAGYVLPPLLSRTDLTPRAVEGAVAATLAWLRDHGDATEAQYVMPSLLSRPDLSPQAAAGGVEVALAWLARHGETADAQFVLHALLGRPDLSPPAEQRGIEFALGWLRLHGRDTEAQFVLRPLLGRPDAPPEAVELALAWLQRHGETVDAGYVLSPSLGRADMPSGAVSIALDWLRPYGETSDAGYVLPPLLSRTDLSPEAAAHTVGAALAWLRQHGESIDAQFMLHSLLDRPDLPPQAAQDAVEIALAWLQQHGDTTGAGYVLPPLLAIRRVADLPEWLPEVVDRWADKHRSSPDVVFVSKYLARQNALTEITAEVVLQWADEHRRDVDIPWRLTGVAAGINRYPNLTGALLTHVETYLYDIADDLTGVNAHGELDGLMQNLCRARPLRCGLGGALLDDALAVWLSYPVSLNPKCPTGIHFTDAAGRICALVRAGRFAPGRAVEVVSRLHTWIGQWTPAEPYAEQRDRACAEVAALLAQLKP